MTIQAVLARRTVPFLIFDDLHGLPQAASLAGCPLPFKEWVDRSRELPVPVKDRGCRKVLAVESQAAAKTERRTVGREFA